MIFVDPIVQDSFDRDGYVILDFFEGEQIEKLLNQYHSIDHINDSVFTVSLDEANYSKKRKIAENIEQVALKKVQEHFKDYQIFTSSFVTKKYGKKFIIPPHQDWTFVDETEFYSVTCWSPLVDTDYKNGALAVIPGSHKLFEYARCSPSPESKSLLSDHVFTLFPYVKSIDLKAGQAIIFDNRLIHASTPNLTDAARIAVGLGVTSKQAQLLHYYEDPRSENKKMICYEVDKDFFYKWNNKNLSDLYQDNQLIPDFANREVVSIEKEDLSKEEMILKVNGLGTTEYNKPLMDYLKTLFSKELNSSNQVEEKEELEMDPISSTEKRSFFQIYTPVNIVREIGWRLFKIK